MINQSFLPTCLCTKFKAKKHHLTSPSTMLVVAVTPEMKNIRRNDLLTRLCEAGRNTEFE